MRASFQKQLEKRRFGLRAIDLLGIEAFGDCGLTQVAAGAAGSVPIPVCQQGVVTADAIGGSRTATLEGIARWRGVAKRKKSRCESKVPRPPP